MKQRYWNSLIKFRGFLFCFFFFFSNFSEDVSQKSHLQISQSVIQKKQKYLLRGFLAQQDSVLLSSSLQSRVVFFQKREGFIYMLNDGEGQVINPDFSELALARFSVIKETKDYVLIDWSEGMDKVYTNSSFIASDFEVDNPFEGPVFESHLSYVKEIKFFAEKEEIHIQQIFVAHNENKETHYQLFYILSPYKENKDFKPREDKKEDKFKHYGFFETHPLLKEGKQVIYTGKWDLKKPFLFYISSNTPKEYISAIKAGVLYWNRILETDFLTVKESSQEDNIHLPHAHTSKKNVIQWSDVDLGFAYADFTYDPLTGEQLQGAVYMGVGTHEQLEKYLEIPETTDSKIIKNS